MGCTCWYIIGFYLYLLYDGIATPPFLFFSTYFSFLFHLFPIPFLILFPLPSSLLEPSSLTAQRPDYTTILSSLLTLFGYHFILP